MPSTARKSYEAPSTTDARCDSDFCHSQRYIPLTAFTLLTVPEESMLSEFAKDDTVDMGLRLMRPQAEKGTLRNDSEQRDKVARNGTIIRNRYRETATPDRHRDKASVDRNMDTDTNNTDGVRLINDLDKFMGALTARYSPKTVIDTIASSKDSTDRNNTRF